MYRYKRDNKVRLSTSDLRVVRETSTTEPVTLAEAKNYLRIVNSDDDALITSMITNARRQCERYLNSDIVPKERVVYYDYLSEDINLYYAPIASISSITVDGVAQVADEGYELLGLDNPLVSLQNRIAEKVEITYTTAGLPAEDVNIGVLACIAWLYYGRDAVMSTNYKAWLSPFKIFGYYGIR